MKSIDPNESEISSTDITDENAVSAKRKPQNGKLFLEMVVCILLPTLILKKLSGDDMLGTNWALVAALSLPIGMGIYDFVTNRKIAFVPALGFISI